MLRSQIPTKMPTPWAELADPAYVRDVPVVSQVGISAGAASFETGYPPLTFTPVDAGGIPPFGQDENGAFRGVTRWLRYLQAGLAALYYDAAFATSIGGYPQGAVLESSIVPGKLWYNTADSNVANPDAFGAGWICHPSTLPTGAKINQPTSEVVPGTVAAIGQTIGSAASGAVEASAANVFLYVWVWNNFSNTECPVSGGRGANGLADFNAGKPMVMPNWTGTGELGMDANGSTRLSSVPAVTGSRTVPGSVLGEVLHTNILAEIPATTPAGSVSSSFSGSGSLPYAFNPVAGGGSFQAISNVGGAIGVSVSGSVSSSFSGTSNNGGNGPHNNVQRSVIGNWRLKQ